MLVRCPTCQTIYRVDANVPVISGQAVHCGACGADFELRSHIIRRSPVPGVAKAASLAEPAVVKARPLPYSATAAPAPRPVSGQKMPAPPVSGDESPALGPESATSEAAVAPSPPSAFPADASPAGWRATPPGETPSDAGDVRWSLGAPRRPAAGAADRSGSLSSADHAADQRSQPQAASSIELLPRSATAPPVSGHEAPAPGPGSMTSEAAPSTTAPSAPLADVVPAGWRATPPGETPSDAVDVRWSLGAPRRPAAGAADRSGSLSSADHAAARRSEPQAASSIESPPHEQVFSDASEPGNQAPVSSRDAAAEPAPVATGSAAATNVEPAAAESGRVEATGSGSETAESALPTAKPTVAPSVISRSDANGLTRTVPEVTPEEPPRRSQVAYSPRPSPLKRLLSGNPALSSEATRLPDPPARKAPSPWQRPPDESPSAAVQSPPSSATTQLPAATPPSASNASPPSTPSASPSPGMLHAPVRPEPASPRGATVRPAQTTDSRWSIAPSPPVTDDPLATRDVSAIPEVVPAEQAKRFSLQAAARRTSAAEPDSPVVGTRQREGVSSRRGSEPAVDDALSALAATGRSSSSPLSSTPGWSRPRSLIGRFSANQWLQSLAALLLVAVLAVQLIYAQRLSLADSERGRPLAEAVCAWLGCSLPLPHADGRVRLVRGTVTEHPEETLALQMSALLVNESSERAAYPLLRLRLLNDAQRVSAERRFHPSEYLDEADRALWQEGLAPGQAVSARLAIVAPASGSDQFLIDLHR